MKNEPKTMKNKLNKPMQNTEVKYAMHNINDEYDRKKKTICPFELKIVWKRKMPK